MSEKNTSKRRVAGSYAMSLVSITLMLFLLGLFAIFVMYARKLSNHIKENIGFEVVMYGNVTEGDVRSLEAEFKAMPAVKETNFITKDEALSRLSEDLGEDFLEWLGKDANPLLPSIDVRFHANYVNTDSIEVIAAQIRERHMNEVKDVYYQKSLVDLINQNIGKIAVVLMVVSLILLVIAVALIRNTIRLSIYAKRFLVRSMQLVGATESFIRRPFLKSGVMQGFFAGVLADLMLIGILFAALKRINDLELIQDNLLIVIILCGVIVLGVVLAWFSTRSALNKFLKADLDKLYN